MHKVYVTEAAHSMYHGTYHVPYAGMDFRMAKERAGTSAVIKVWLEGTHIETYERRKVEEHEPKQWVKIFDRKVRLEEEIRKANLELDALTAAHILLQEEK